MKIKYLGTSAHEGLPALFCKCANCTEARKQGGKNIRTRSQALINSDLLIDFNADTYMHSIMYGLDLSEMHNCIITHAHPDHLYTDNINLRLPAYSNIYNRQIFNIYGSDIVIEKLKSEFKRPDPTKDNVAAFRAVECYKSFFVLDYEITALPARHDPQSGAVIYIIRCGNKCMLYAHDTGVFFEEVFDYLKCRGVYFDFVSMDCTAGFKDIDYDVHMNIKRNIIVRNRMMQQGNTDKNTIFYINHFSHNSEHILFDDMSEKAGKLGFNVAYDGLEVEF